MTLLNAESSTNILKLAMHEPRSQPPHIALLSDTGTGHLIPIASLAKHLLNKLKFSVTLITQPTSLSSQSQQAILNTLPKEISVVPLPHIPAEEIPKGGQSHGASLLTAAHNLPHLRDVLKSLLSSNPNTILIVDMFGAFAHDVAREVGVPLYLFFTTNCMVLSLAHYFMKLDAVTNGQFTGVPELIRMPGCVPLIERDIPDPFHDRDREGFKEFLKLLKSHFVAKAILVNSVEELESGAIGALKADETVPPVYAIGPVLWLGSSLAGSEPERPECLKWLDKQPEGSVIYVSFGSGGTLTCKQMGELALGLEMSGQRFLWVVRCPNESDASGDYFGVTDAGRSPIEFLPEGFIERTKGMGQVVPTWAPQMEILSHGATGGFVSHCGWNSCLEGIVNAVPMIAWPLFAEQRTNAVMLADDLKVAARIRVGEDGVVRREAIAELVKDVMDGAVGRGLRKRMKEVKEAASSALDDGGSSSRALFEIAREWNNLKQ